MTPLQRGHVSGIHRLRKSLHAINLSQHVIKITADFITSKKNHTLKWIFNF